MEILCRVKHVDFNGIVVMTTISCKLDDFPAKDESLLLPDKGIKDDSLSLYKLIQNTFRCKVTHYKYPYCFSVLYDTLSNLSHSYWDASMKRLKLSQNV